MTIIHVCVCVCACVCVRVRVCVRAFNFNILQLATCSVNDIYIYVVCFYVTKMYLSWHYNACSATIVESTEVYWVKVKSDLISASSGIVSGKYIPKQYK